MQMNWKRVLGLTAVLILGVSVGCSNDTVTSAEQDAIVLELPNGEGSLARPGSDTVKSVTTLVTNKGAVLSTGRVALYIPPGALKLNTEITISQTFTARGEVEFELLPHGLEFREDVVLYVNMQKLANPHDDIRQYWFNDRTDEWEDMDGTYYYPWLTTEIDHFSRWKAGRAGW